MRKATVIETYPGRAIIMTEDCRFIEIKTNRPLRAGEEIEYTGSDIIVNRRAATTLAWAASLLLFVLLTYSLTAHLVTGRIYACIGIDINPSLEMCVDHGLRVIETSSFNQQGDQIIAAVKPKGQKLETALAAVVSYSKTAGYLGPSGDAVGVSLSMYSDLEKSGELMTRIDRVLQQELAANRSQANIYYFTIDKETREQAVKEKVSPVSYLLWQEARKEGIVLKQKDVTLRNPSIEKIARKTATRLRIRGQGSSSGIEQGQQPDTVQEHPVKRGEQPLSQKKKDWFNNTKGMTPNTLRNLTKEAPGSDTQASPDLLQKKVRN